MSSMPPEFEISYQYDNEGLPLSAKKKQVSYGDYSYDIEYILFLKNDVKKILYSWIKHNQTNHYCNN